MRKVSIYITVLFILFTVSAISCSGNRLDYDAKKAAELTRSSMEYMENKDMEKAEKAYMDARKIISKYDNEGQTKEFYEAYDTYLYGGKSTE